MRKEIARLREKMKEKEIDACLVPTSDFHGSEYVSDHFKCREYLSGFTGSAGTLVVTQTKAGLWTDEDISCRRKNSWPARELPFKKTGSRACLP